MKNGRVIFQGTVADMAHEARGNVWMVTTQGLKPEGNFTVVSTMNMGTTMQYRIVGGYPTRGEAVPVEPSLEDGYVWLMHEQQVSQRIPIA